jgi:hypothetical protein
VWREPGATGRPWPGTYEPWATPWWRWTALTGGPGDRGGDRIANNALWRIDMVRMSTDPRTRNYVQRRIKEGLSKKEIIRCLKRYVAREVYHHLEGVDEQ